MRRVPYLLGLREPAAYTQAMRMLAILSAATLALLRVSSPRLALKFNSAFKMVASSWSPGMRPIR